MGVRGPLLSIHCLAGCDGNHLVDVVNRASAAQVVHRASDTLEDRADSVGTAKTLNELVADVANLEAWSNENVSLACDV
jgi:hypothetical protein